MKNFEKRKSLIFHFFLATDALRSKFAEMKDGHIRVVTVVIENGLNDLIS